ncbi:tyrosine-tRNA ligase [Cladophialophora bantiana CBS 173.52]|uniref:Tyrosine--tRNA ligase n=1 Tax=Cladophialophora bantiana (strain ATCC 10958 / CBS 173.52 / CDC B-1940 / NIH 8579) TaxID=1442370 RepID=A0A0D2EKN4_CLAB1|nr:tyrosine-tRNA ligase [Cladophialophora bantiana CBS 173.52]KIW90531.1 tyrosine-tRNA ligase [Cladophialophora bantiana CBS 173.52]
MAGKELSPQEKLTLIKDQLQEVLREDILENVILKEQRPLVVYWGTATTGRPHCGYFVPMMKIAHFLRAGCRVKILLADIHGFLDNLKAPIELVKFRAQYYKYVIQSLLRAVGVSLEKLEFVLGSSYQLSAEYTMDVFRLSSVVTEHDAKKAGAEVVKQVENATLSGLIYPLMQALDEHHLGVDAQFGGVDQRKIFTLAQEALPRVGYKERAHLMNPMVPGLAGGKMSASEPDSKIDILDTAETVRKKLRKAYAATGEVEGNGLISFVEYVLLPISALRDPEGKGTFMCERKEGEGESLVYHDIETLKEDYRTDKLTPQLLKAGTTAAIIELLEPIQAEFQASAEWQEIEKKAYPPPPEPEKKKKKQPKDKGSRHPGAAKVTAEADGSVEGEGKEQVEVGKTAEQAMSNLEINGQPA